MRIAVLIIGLILGAFMVVQSTLLAGLSGVAKDTATNTASYGGLLMALLWLVACALVIPIPIISAILFLVAGMIGFALSKDFPDLSTWGIVSFALAVLSVIGWIGKRRGERREATRHAELVTAASRQPE